MSTIITGDVTLTRVGRTSAPYVTHRGDRTYGLLSQTAATNCRRNARPASLDSPAIITSDALITRAGHTCMPYVTCGGYTPAAATDVATKPPTPAAISCGKAIIRGMRRNSRSDSYEAMVRSHEVLSSLEKWAEKEVLPVFLKPVEKSWQPQDFLPDPCGPSFHDEVHELRARSRDLPDDYLVCLVGDMITEEALPTYSTCLTRCFVRPPTSDQELRDDLRTSPWAAWIRLWSAEENRHGDLLNKYLYLSGKVDMLSVEKTIHYLIGSGMDVGMKNPYLGFIYTSFQERATFISHGNTARQAKEFGDIQLAKICGTIAADEKRHEQAYTKIVEKLFELDPDGTMVALQFMMQHKIIMPAHLLFDGNDHSIFDHFSQVAQRLGVYTAKDYTNNLDHFIKRWGIDKRELYSSEARAAQDYICTLPARLRCLEERAHNRKPNKNASKNYPFSWIFNHQVALI